MYNPFLTSKHCARYATRRAFQTGNVFHVVATNNDQFPLDVVNDSDLFELGDRVTPDDLVFTADPFAASVA